MAKGLYRSCQFCGEYFHPDELIRFPEGARGPHQVRLCLPHADDFLKHMITREQCRAEKRDKRRAA